MAKVKRQNIREIITKRFIAFFIVVVMLFLVLVINLYKIVFINGETLRNDVFNTYIKEPREEIFTRMMEVYWRLLCLNTG